MDYEEQIEYVLRYGIDNLPYWLPLQPKVYFKDGVPYGLIATVYDSRSKVYYIASTTALPEQRFSVGMIRDLFKLSKSKRICLVTEQKGYREQIRSVLSSLGGFTFREDENALFSYNFDVKER